MTRRHFCALPTASAIPLGAQSPTDANHGASKTAIERWKDMSFGMFIHWGPVSIVGTEIGWSRGAERRGRTGVGEVPVEVYDNLYRMFNPRKFDPDEWVQLAKDAGMKYLVFTTKHHDGFINFDSKLTGYKITGPKAAYKKDIVRMLSDACRRGGIDWGVYYSQPDWHHPDYLNGAAHAKYVEYLHGQVRELLTGYGPTRMWFFDGLRASAADWDTPRLLRMMRQLEPGLIINNRAGVPADIDTPEQRIGMFQNDRPWETCATVATQWAYKPNDTPRSVEECLRGLVCCAIGDGNLLLNVGPRPDGTIEPSHAARLREMGDFLKKYGESIYATRGGPFIAPNSENRLANADPSPAAVHRSRFAFPEGNWWGGSTHRGNSIYLHILRWPSNTISLPVIPRRIVRSSVITGGSCTVKQEDSGIQISVPVQWRQPVDTIVRLELDGPASAIPAIRPA